MLFVLAFLFYNDGVQTVIDVSGAYAEDTLGLSTEEIVIAFLIVQFVAFFGALGFGVLADRIGTRPAIMVSLAGWSLVPSAATCCPAGETTPLYVLAVFIGLVLGGVQALSRSLYGSMIPEEASAEFYGFFSVFSKFSAIFGPLGVRRGVPRRRVGTTGDPVDRRLLRHRDGDPEPGGRRRGPRLARRTGGSPGPRSRRLRRGLSGRITPVDR